MTTSTDLIATLSDANPIPDPTAAVDGDAMERTRRAITASTTPAVPWPARRGRTRGSMRLVLSGACLSAATTAVVLFATGGNVASPAYAVESNPDGTVSVQINSLKDADGLQQKLRAAGVPAVVRYIPASDLENCPAGGPAGIRDTNGAPPKDGSTRKVTSSTSVDQDGHATFTLNPSDLDRDEHVLVTTSDGTVSTVAVQIARADTAAGPGAGAGVPACHRPDGK
jgi:hypothetical protein